MNTFCCRMVLILLFLPVLIWSQNIQDHARVKEAIQLAELWLDAQKDYEQIPGISVAVVHDQDLVWSGAFGYAHPEKKAAASTQTIYSICSISKLFTSIAIMQLRDAGKLRLDDPIARHLPEYTLKQKYSNSPEVTIRGVLTHSSGLPRESNHPYWSPPDFKFPMRDQIIEELDRQETLYPADTYFQYSNLGMSLAGEIVAHISGQSYADYVRQNILKPLGLNDTRPFLPENETGKRLATGYSAITRQGNRKKVPFFQANGIAAAAGYSSTVEELARFASWQFRLLKNKDTEILTANTLREMHRVHWTDADWKTTWGLGFSVWQRKETTFVSHGGSCPGFRSHFVLEPRNRIGIIFMANASGIDVSKYTAGLYDMFGQAIKEALDSTTTEKIADETLVRFCGSYSQEPWGGEIQAIIWKGQLALVYFPGNEPLAGLETLKHIEDNRFRRVRSDGEEGEEIVFELDAKGEVTALVRHSNRWPRVNMK